MLMSEWMEKQGIEPIDIVKAIRKKKMQVTEDMVRRVRDGRRRFSPEKTRIVIEMSGRTVTWEEMFFPEEFWKAG